MIHATYTMPFDCPQAELEALVLHHDFHHQQLEDLTNISNPDWEVSMAIRRTKTKLDEIKATIERFRAVHGMSLE